MSAPLPGQQGGASSAASCCCQQCPLLPCCTCPERSRYEHRCPAHPRTFSSHIQPACARTTRHGAARGCRSNTSSSRAQAPSLSTSAGSVYTPVSRPAAQRAPGGGGSWHASDKAGALGAFPRPAACVAWATSAPEAACFWMRDKIEAIYKVRRCSLWPEVAGAADQPCSCP